MIYRELIAKKKIWDYEFKYKKDIFQGLKDRVYGPPQL